jgi:hypothetical protein
MHDWLFALLLLLGVWGAVGIDDGSVFGPQDVRLMDGGIIPPKSAAVRAMDGGIIPPKSTAVRAMDGGIIPPKF